MLRTGTILIFILFAVSCAKPRDPEALRVGLTLLEGREYEQALRQLVKVGEEHPGSLYEARALLALGFVHEFGFQDLAKAEEAYRLFLDKFPQAPNRSQVLWDASSCAYWRNRFEQVLEDIEEIRKLGGIRASPVEKGPEGSDVSRDDDIEAVLLFRRGTSLAHLTRWKEAAATFKDFVAAYPAHSLTPSAFLLQAWALENEEGVEAARRVLSAAQEKKMLGELTWAARRELNRLSLAQPDESTEEPREGSPSDLSL